VVGVFPGKLAQIWRGCGDGLCRVSMEFSRTGVYSSKYRNLTERDFPRGGNGEGPEPLGRGFCVVGEFALFFLEVVPAALGSLGLFGEAGVESFVLEWGVGPVLEPGAEFHLSPWLCGI